MNNNYTWLSDDASIDKLAFLINSLDENIFIALDTEFIRTKTYYPEFALLQLCILDEVYLVDPLNTDLKPLIKALFATKACVLTFSGNEDLEVLIKKGRDLQLQEEDLYFKNYCDLQMLEGFVGLEFPLSLQNSCSEYLQINLSKSETCSNWLQRPLDEAQYKYAMEDVLYLKDLYLALIPKLKDNVKGYFYAEMLHIQQKQHDVLDENEAYRYANFASRFSKDKLYVVQYVLKERLKYARLHDIALNRLLTNKALPILFNNFPKNLFDLKKASVNQYCIKSYGHLILKWFNEALKNRDKVELKEVIGTALTTNRTEQDKLRHLKFHIEQKSKELSIDSKIVASKNDLQAFFTKDMHCILRYGWRAQMLGDLKEFL